MNIALKALCLPVAFAALTVTGCASVQYGDARAVETVDRKSVV